MYTPMNSKHFTKRVNENGVNYWVLSTHVAPVQQGFYFVNSGCSDDGRYLWFYCAFPPAEGHSLGVIDFLSDEVHYFPETLGSGWMVDGPTGNVYWGCKQGIFMRTPHPHEKAIKIADIPAEIKKLNISGTGTHLTFTPDRKEIVVDIQTACGSFIGSFNVKDGSYTQWYRTVPDIPYNHTQTCPTDGDLCMCAHEVSWSTETGQYELPELVDGVYPRLQLIRRDGSREMRKPYKNFATHEWWAADGKSIYYCSSQSIVQDKLGDNEAECICYIPIEGGNGTWHAHSTMDDKYFVVDGSWPSEGLTWWRGCPSLVRFYNNESKKIIDIVTYNPVVEGWSSKNPGSYHIDPHPRFVKNDEWVTFTTTVAGRVDMAVAETKQLIEMSK